VEGGEGGRAGGYQGLPGAATTYQDRGASEAWGRPRQEEKAVA
jgi:hypothetical protein